MWIDSGHAKRVALNSPCAGVQNRRPLGDFRARWGSAARILGLTGSTHKWRVAWQSTCIMTWELRLTSGVQGLEFPRIRGPRLRGNILGLY